MAQEFVLVGEGGNGHYQSWSLAELKAAISAAQHQMSAVEGMHASFAQSSHQLAALVDSIGLSRNAVAANWVGPAGSAAAQSSSNMQAFSAAAHEASLQSATATRELHRATRNHAQAMHQIKHVDTSYHKSLAASGGNPAAATVDHHKRVQESEQNRQRAVRQAQLLDAKGDEYHTMLKRTQWPTMQSNGSTTVPTTTHYPTVPNTPTTNPQPVTPVTTTPASTGPVTPVVLGSRTPRNVDGSTTTAGLGAGLGGSGGLGGAGGSGAGGTGGLGGLGGGLGGSGTGGLAGEGALAGAGGASGARGGLGEASRGALAEESRVGSRGRGLLAEEGRGGMYGPGGGRRNGDDEEEKRRPDYLEEDEDPWGLGIEDAVPAVIGEEGTRHGE